MARVTPSGSFTWATEATAPGSIVGNGITGTATAALPDGSVLAVGVVNQTATFTNTATGNPITAASLGAGDVYVAKLAADGRYVWVTLAGGLEYDQATGIPALADGWVHAIALQGDGKVVFAGTFNNVSTSGRTKVARVHANGDVDGTFTPNITGLTGFAVNAVAVQSNGKIVIGGDFLQADGVNQRRVARLQSDGRRDPSFADPVIVGTIHSLYVRSDERVIVAGEFVSVNSEPRLGRARLRATGTVDTAFPNPLVRALATSNTSSGLYAVARIRDGKSVIGGRIFSVQGVPRTGVAALFG